MAASCITTAKASWSSLLAVALSAGLAAAPIGAQPSIPAGMPDLSGVWMNDNTLDERMKREGRTRQTDAEVAPRVAANDAALLTPAYVPIYEQLQAETAALGEGVATCEWPGMPTIMTYPYPFEILQTPGRVTLLFEAESQVRRIFLDRTEHLPADELDPSYNGDSIGHFEGNTLVIDTIGFNTRRPVRGLPHSDQLHIIERLTLVAPDQLHDEITLIDNAAFVQPVVINVDYSRRPDWRIREYSCAENNRDAPDGNGGRAGALK